jgi:hypothetical protein
MCSIDLHHDLVLFQVLKNFEECCVSAGIKCTLEKALQLLRNQSYNTSIIIYRRIPREASKNCTSIGASFEFLMATLSHRLIPYTKHENCLFYGPLTELVGSCAIESSMFSGGS